MTAGQDLAHESAVEHVTGKARYVDDLTPLHNQLFVAIGRSTIAYGRLVKLDLSGVWNSTGVVDVLTHSDLEHATDIGPVFGGDPLLVEDTVEYQGQALFAVAATSHRLAKQAVKKAVVEYEESTPLLAIEAAIEEKAYVRPPHRMKTGDAELALIQAPNRIQGQFKIGGQEHFYLEGQVARAQLEEDGGVTVWSSNQNPTETQHLVANVLGLTMNRVNVIVRRMGGGFGGKETQATACASFAALFAVRQGGAVSCRLSRQDDMVMTGKRHGFLNRYDVGFDDTGRITAIAFVLAGQCGYSADLSDAIVDRAMFHCDNAYYLPHATIDGLRCKTHTVSNTAFRGFGGPQGMMAIESVIDHIAAHLKLDPLTVRRANFYDGADRNTTPYGQNVTSFTVPELFNQLENSSDYIRRREEIRQFNQARDTVKRGIAMTPVKFGISFTVKHLNQAGALIHIYNDGSVQLNHGGTEMGQGLMVKVQQLVAAELGVSTNRIAVMATRTDKVPNSSATAASSGTDLNGMAAVIAAKTLKDRLGQFARELADKPDATFRFNNDQIYLETNGESQWVYQWDELVRKAYLERVPLSATGYYRTPDIHYDRATAKGQPFYYFANGAAVSEVEIDTLTGETRLLRTDILHDVGNSVNPAVDIGQIEGGFIQGVGWLTHEELVWDSQGRLLTDGPATYKIPAISDIPEVFNVQLLKDCPNPANTVFRSKAVGEPPLMLAISVFSAIRDAISATQNHSKFANLNAPATPEEVLRACSALSQ